jgi:hypothetical protein
VSEKDDNVYPMPAKVEGVTANTRHVDAQEAMQAADPCVGEGTPGTASWVLPPAEGGVKPKLMTLGTSPKAKVAALLTSTVGSLGSIGITYLLMGELDKAALAGVLTGAMSGLLAFVGAWLGNPGDVVEVTPVDEPDVTPQTG